MKKIIALLLSALMLASVASVTAGAAGEYPFTDVSEDHPAREAIQYLYELDLMKGVGDGIFAPGSYYTRAMFVTMLGRMEGVDTAQYPGSAFQDVDPKSPSLGWAAPYINWAAESDIVKGVGSGKFSPNGIITEEQYCAIVCRYLDFKGYDFPGAPIWKPEIADASDISTWALPSVVNMVYYNLSLLTREGYFLPQNRMNRGDIAYVFADLYYMLENDVCPSLVYDPATFGDLEEEDFVNLTRQAAAYLGNWFYFNSYCDPSDNVTTGYGIYDRVINPYFHTKKDVVEQGYRFFLFDVSQQMKEEKNILEQGMELYLSETEGLGGFMIDRAVMDLDTESEGYEVTFTYYAGDEVMGSQTTHLRFDQSMGRWVFTDLIYPDLAVIDIQVNWG